MALEIKQLGSGSVNLNTSNHPLLATNPVASGKAVIVKNVRLTNKSGTTAATLNLLFNDGTNSRQLSPVDLSLAPKAMYVDNDEVTLEQGHKLLLTVANVANSGPIEYVVSGIQRDA